MKKTNPTNNQQPVMSNFAFTLVEVLVFVSILALFFVAAAAVTTVSLRNMKINEHKILATRYAQELLEWLRGQKEIDWNQFVNNYTSSSGKTYCFNQLNWNTLGNCSHYNGLIPSIYKREATLTKIGNPAYQVNVNIKVEWQEIGNTYSVPINTVLTIWE